MLLQPILSHLAIGGGLFYGVQKPLQIVGDMLSETTKLEIAVWLLDIKAATAVHNWPSTFATVFDRVFGVKHLSWKSFRRSCVTSLISVAILCLIWAATQPAYFAGFLAGSARPTYIPLISILFGAVVFNFLPDYISLLETRWVIGLMARAQSNEVKEQQTDPLDIGCPPATRPQTRSESGGKSRIRRPGR